MGFEKPWLNYNQYSIYRLSEDDKQYCADIANHRHYGSKLLNLKEKAYDLRKGGLWSNYKGVIGEFVFCMVYRLDPKSIRVAYDPDDGSDITAWGKRHSVRCTEGASIGFILRSWDKLLFDYGSLFYMKQDVVRALGFFARNRIKSIAVVWRDQHQVPRDRLEDWQLLPFQCGNGDNWIEEYKKSLPGG